VLQGEGWCSYTPAAGSVGSFGGHLQLQRVIEPSALLFEGTYRRVLTGKEAYRYSAPDLGSSVDCLKWRRIQVSHPTAGRGEAGHCVKESDTAAEGDGEKITVSEAAHRPSRAVTGTPLHPLKAEALWDHMRWKDRGEPGAQLRNKSCTLVPF